MATTPLERPKTRWQFSLAGMLLAVTALSILLAIHVAAFQSLAAPNATPGYADSAISLLVVLDFNVAFWLFCWAATINRIVRKIAGTIMVAIGLLVLSHLAVVVLIVVSANVAIALPR